MALQITTGLIPGPTKAVIYGPEGVGKSTLGAALPKPLFIDVENSTRKLDVARTPAPTSWTHFLEIVRQIVADQMGYETLVIDTADKLERLSINHVCGTTGYTSLGGREDYGKSYNELAGLWESLLTMLETDLILAKKMHVVFLAHSETRRFELPEEEGAFDRYELAMEKKTRPILKEWADLLLFCNYKTIVNVETNKKGEILKAKGAGGTRRMCYAQRTAAYDAKNRDGLPPEFDLDIANLQPVFSWKPMGSLANAQAPSRPAPPPAPAPAPAPEPAPPPGPAMDGANARLVALMQESGVEWEDLLEVMVARGKAAQGTTVENVNEGLIDQWVMPHWDKITTAIRNAKETAHA